MHPCQCILFCCRKRIYEEACAEFEETFAANGGTTGGPRAYELGSMRSRISELEMQSQAETDELTQVKDSIKANDSDQAEARAEAAAQRMMLEEDAELRKAIQVRDFDDVKLA